MKTSNIIWYFLLLILLAILGLCGWFLSHTYAAIIQFAVDSLHRPDLKSLLTQNFFSIQKYDLVRRLAFLISAVSIALSFLLIVKKKWLLNKFTALEAQIRHNGMCFFASIKNSSPKIKMGLAALFFIILVRSVYFALHFYPQYDECWNYNYFLSNGFITNFFAYNNYPLHNIITLVFLKLLPNTTFAMRLPNIILGLFNLLLVFVLAKKIFGRELLALVACALFASLPTLVFYFLFARGVMLSLTFAILILFYFFVKKPAAWQRADILTLAFLGALGCFSMISFPMYLLLIFTFFGIKSLLQKDADALRNILWGGAICLVLTLLFYLPMLLGTGLSPGIHSAYSTNAINLKTILNQAQFVSRDQIGFQFGAYIFMVLSIFLWLVTERKKIILFNIFLLLLPFIVPLIFKTFLPARALAFQAFAYLFTLCILLEQLLKHQKKSLFIAISILCICLFNYVSLNHTFFDWSAKPDRSAAEIASIFQQKGISSYYDKSGTFQYFVPGILYHHRIKNKVIEFYTSSKSSTRYQRLDQYQGNCIVDKKETYVPQAEHEILFEYTDVDPNITHENFVIYKTKK